MKENNRNLHPRPSARCLDEREDLYTAVDRVPEIAAAHVELNRKDKEVRSMLKHIPGAEASIVALVNGYGDIAAAKMDAAYMYGRTRGAEAAAALLLGLHWPGGADDQREALAMAISARHAEAVQAAASKVFNLLQEQPAALPPLHVWRDVMATASASSSSTVYATGFRHGAAENADPDAENDDLEAALLAADKAHHPAIDSTGELLHRFAANIPGAREALRRLDIALTAERADLERAFYTLGRRHGAFAALTGTAEETEETCASE